MKRFGLLAVLVVVGCYDPYKETLPSGPVKEWGDATAMKKAIEKLPSADADLLRAYVMRQGLAGVLTGQGIPAGTTIRHAIEDQKRFQEERVRREAEEQALAVKVAAQRAARTDEMNRVVTLAVTDVRFVKSDWQAGRYDDVIEIRIAVANKTDRDIAGVKGHVEFADMFGDGIKSIGLAIDDAIKANGTLTWKGSMDFNQFRAEDKKLASTPLEKLKVTWVPDTIIFQDGTKLTSPE